MQIRCIHLSDCGPAEDSHLPFDSGGVLPITDFLSLLVKMRFKGTINLELQPKSISDLEPVLKSYLKVLRHFKKGKYWKTKARLMFFTPMIRMLIS
jgi:sugar phosphate isomerase/epimerase